MPELPDIELYVQAIATRVVDRTLKDVRIANPFLLRSVEPPLSDVRGRDVLQVRRIGKRVALGLADDYWLVLHLMIAGRLHWHEEAPTLSARNRLASFDFDNGSLMLTEAGSKKRASLYAVHGSADLAQHDPGGVEPLTCSFERFVAELQAENRTLKRALTNPRRFSGIGNAYSDEILHHARLSPAKLTSRLSTDEQRRLYSATQETLSDWTNKLVADAAGAFPTKVTAFKSTMAVHGRFGKPCPVCGQPIQRIRYKSRETNYCAQCQTGGKVLADRSLSRLLKDDWPSTLDDA